MTQKKQDIRRSRRLTFREVEEIHNRYEAGESQAYIARVLDVSPSTIHAIVHGYRHPRAYWRRVRGRLDQVVEEATRAERTPTDK